MHAVFRLSIGLVLALALATSAAAEKKAPLIADVVGSAVTRNLDGTFDIRATVRSADKGTEQYCDRIEVLDPSGSLLFTIRVLKPHAKEQPFSVTARSVLLPEGIDHVVLRARMRQGGASGKDRTVKLPPKKK